ncbi:MAG TPA: hypothetical protein HPP77_05975 [Candidatus Hydrogenedentes bacterium]|nr:hypothetical protein [Candidatus Hydrogenedentota bacterium]HIJ74252.1 hypothetical protein [Candidatus Hydrogenedentota bacterium]
MPKTKDNPAPSPRSPAGWRRRRIWHGAVYFRVKRWRRDLVAVLEQIAGLVRCNAPLAAGLNAAAADAPNRAVEYMLLAVRDDVAAGLPLAEAMQRYPHFFPPYCTQLTAVGEQSGRLAQCLSDLAESTISSEAIRGKLRRVSAYLALILAMHAAFGAFIALKIAPVFADMIHEAGGRTSGPLRVLTRPVAAFPNEPMVALVLPAFVVGLLSGLLVIAWLRRLGVIARTDFGVPLCVPYVRGMVVRGDLGRIAHVLATLLKAGAPLDAALASAASLDVRKRYARALKNVRDGVRGGETLGSAVDAERRTFPKSFRALAALGESSGMLPEALERLAQQYLREAAKRAKILLNTIAPLCVVAVGCVTCFIWVALFVSYCSMADILAASM